jgi:uncharacterized protein DUF4365
VRASANAGKGSAGQSFVKGQFEELDWGANLNVEHDLGTDLWLMARDERRFDLRELVGAQVKAGPSYFDSPEYDDAGEVAGWWYAERDDSHFDYWCDHSIPHLLVLHDLKTHTSYWVHVTREKLESTGKGRKILVPATSTIDKAHFEDLVSVAVSRRPVWRWEGSAWDGASTVPRAALLRYSLVTPRLVAPHPNKGQKELDAHEAVAMLVQMRLSEIQRFGKDEGVDIDAARTSDSWEWRLFAALYDWVVEGNREGLIGSAADADLTHQRVAASVCLALALLEDGRPEDAAEHLRRELDGDEADPADFAWLLAQLFQCQQELGDLAGARQTALDVQARHRTGSSDPTASAFAASAANLVFTLGNWDEPTLAGAVRSSDTVPSWWRSQTMAYGLAYHFDESFKTWVGDTSTTFGSGDQAWLKLRSTMLLAGFAADRPGWKNAGSRLARRQLMTTSDTDPVVAALDLLRLSGEDKLIRLAVARLLRLGPTEPLERVGSQLKFEASTRSSLHADIEFVRSAADVLATADCVRFLGWALSTLDDPSGLIDRLSPTFLINDAILGMLRSLVNTVDPDARRRVVEHLLALPALNDQLIAQGYGRVLAAIPEDEWLDGDLARLRERPDEDNWEFTDDVATLLAKTDPAFRATLTTRIADGDLSALHSYGNVTELEPETAARAIENLGRAVRGRVEDARRGTFGTGGYDSLDALVLLNAWHPDVSDWDAVEEILSFPGAHPDHVGGGVRRLGLLAEHIPATVRDRFRPHLEGLARSAPPDRATVFRSSMDTRSEAAIALAHLFTDGISDAELLALLRGDAPLRLEAVEIVTARGSESDLNLLALLTNDADVDVRAGAVEGLASWVVRGIAAAEASDLLREVLAEAGPQFAVRVSGALLRDGIDKAAASVLAGLLSDHPSATVRQRVVRSTATSSSSSALDEEVERSQCEVDEATDDDNPRENNDTSADV